MRENEPLVREHAGGLLQAMVACLAAAATDAPELGTVNAALIAVRHMQRIVRVKSGVLRAARDASEASQMEACADALLQFVTAPHNQCRRAAMAAFCDIAPHVVGDVPEEEYAGVVREFLARKTVEAPYTHRIDRILGKVAACKIECSLDSAFGDDGTVAAVQEYMQELAASIDVFVWLARKRYVLLSDDRAPAPAAKRKAASMSSGVVPAAPLAAAMQSIVQRSGLFLRTLLATSERCAAFEERLGCARQDILRYHLGE